MSEIECFKMCVLNLILLVNKVHNFDDFINPSNQVLRLKLKMLWAKTRNTKCIRQYVSCRIMDFVGRVNRHLTSKKITFSAYYLM